MSSIRTSSQDYVEYIKSHSKTTSTPEKFHYQKTEQLRNSSSSASPNTQSFAKFLMVEYKKYKRDKKDKKKTNGSYQSLIMDTGILSGRIPRDRYSAEDSINLSEIARNNMDSPIKLRKTTEKPPRPPPPLNRQTGTTNLENSGKQKKPAVEQERASNISELHVSELQRKSMPDGIYNPSLKSRSTSRESLKTTNSVKSVNSSQIPQESSEWSKNSNQWSVRSGIEPHETAIKKVLIENELQQKLTDGESLKEITPSGDWNCIDDKGLILERETHWGEYHPTPDINENWTSNVEESMEDTLSKDHWNEKESESVQRNDEKFISNTKTEFKHDKTSEDGKSNWYVGTDDEFYRNNDNKEKGNWDEVDVKNGDWEEIPERADKNWLENNQGGELWERDQPDNTGKWFSHEKGNRFEIENWEPPFEGHDLPIDVIWGNEEDPLNARNDKITENNNRITDNNEDHGNDDYSSLKSEKTSSSWRPQLPSFVTKQIKRLEDKVSETLAQVHRSLVRVDEMDKESESSKQNTLKNKNGDLSVSNQSSENTPLKFVTPAGSPTQMAKFPKGKEKKKNNLDECQPNSKDNWSDCGIQEECVRQEVIEELCFAEEVKKNEVFFPFFDRSEPTSDVNDYLWAPEIETDHSDQFNKEWCDESEKKNCFLEEKIKEEKVVLNEAPPLANKETRNLKFLEENELRWEKFRKTRALWSKDSDDEKHQASSLPSCTKDTDAKRLTNSEESPDEVCSYKIFYLNNMSLILFL